MSDGGSIAMAVDYLSRRCESLVAFLHGDDIASDNSHGESLVRP